MKTVIITLTILITFLLTGCNRKDADIVSKNLSRAADMFEINRRVIFYNGITGEYILNIEGKCSVETQPAKMMLTVVCKVGKDKYKKHFLGISDNVTWFAEQIEPISANAYHYRVIFKPQAIIPDIDFRGDVDSVTDTIVPDNKD